MTMHLRPSHLRRKIAAALLIVAAVLAAHKLAHAQDAADDPTVPEVELFGELEFEGTGFLSDPQFAGQDRDSVSVALEATLLAEWMDGDLSFRLTPFGRIDSADDRRSHFDIREAKFDLQLDNWSFTIGADTVFWGKTEVVHLVDIINQTDAVEDLDDEDRLGQPMLRVSYLADDIGEFSAYYLPYFRERTFPGVDGRLRINPPVNVNAAIYDTGAEEWTPSFALRYDGVFGDVDLGVSAFHGLTRDPAFAIIGGQVLPFYERITQVGIDAQYTTDATLWKAEGIFRAGQRNALFEEQNFVALTGGLEHTLFGFLESNADLGLIAEYAWDSRGGKSLSTFQNDLILGARLALNDEQDTAVLFTGALDVEDGSVGLRLEADRRIAEDWTLGVEGQAFLGLSRGGLGGPFADDHFMRVKLTYFFGVD